MMPSGSFPAGAQLACPLVSGSWSVYASAGCSARSLPNGLQALVVPRGEPCRHGLPTGVRRFSGVLSAGEDTGGTGSGETGGC